MTQPIPSQPEPTLLTLGDIGISRSWVVTSRGHAPLRGSRWTAFDQVVLTRKIPTWAIVCAIIFALLCLLGLLLLLVREDVPQGHVMVTVDADDLHHATYLPVASQNDIAHIHGLVDQARTFAAQAPAL